MKAKKKTHSIRKHGLSRLEKLLQASIRQELKIKALRRDLCALSLQFAQFKAGTVPLCGTLNYDAADHVSRMPFT
jgi:hypothetical protein